MNRTIGFGVALILLSLGVRLIWHRLASDETKITWMMEDMLEGFNEGRAKRSIAGLAEDWSHADRPVDRETIRAFILREAMQSGLGKRDGFPFKVEMPEETLVIEVEEGGQSAELETELRFFHQRSGAGAQAEWELQWDLSLTAMLRQTEDGWRIWKSRHKDIRGALIAD